MRKAAWLSLILSACLTFGCSDNTNTDTGASVSGAPANSTTPPAPADADNTARNAENSTLAQTPLGQSESGTDLQISAAIRKAILDDKSLSVNAQNIKIITANGAVTLRGPVKSEEEKRNIESKAKQVPGVTMVDNLLEVERNP